MKTPIRIVVAVLALGVVALLVAKRETLFAGHALKLSGNIETTEVQVSFQVAGRIEKRIVSEGDQVKAGQEVARLDATELQQAAAQAEAAAKQAQAALAELEAGSRPEEIQQAEAAAAKARALVAELEAGSRPKEIAVAQAAVNAAKADAERLQMDSERAQGLRAADAVAQQEYDHAKALAESAREQQKAAEARLALLQEGPRQEQIDQARAALRQSEATLALVKKGPRAETLDQARARLEQARQVQANARTRLAYAVLASPLAGTVLAQTAESGEFVAAGTPVITVADLGAVWLRVYVPETEIGRVKAGQAVKVSCDTFPGKVYSGTIGFIAAQAEFTPRSVQTPKERVKLVYRVKIDVANPAGELKPGMPADARFAE